MTNTGCVGKACCIGLYALLVATMLTVGCGKMYEGISAQETGGTEATEKTEAAETAETEGRTETTEKTTTAGETETAERTEITEKETTSVQKILASTGAFTLKSEVSASETEEVRSQEPYILPDVFPLELLFSSGAGGWGTTMVLNRDGSFEGCFEDHELGSRGEDYPNGSVYLCNFEGTFGGLSQVNDHTYTMILEELILEKGSGEEWIEDQIRYIASEPRGLEQGHEFVFYTPGTPVAELDQEFVDWWHHAWPVREGKMDALDCYGLYHKEEGIGFFTHEP